MVRRTRVVNFLPPDAERQVWEEVEILRWTTDGFLSSAAPDTLAPLVPLPEEM